MLIGFAVAGQITDRHAQDGVHAWQSVWLFPAGLAFVVFVLFLLLFRDAASRTEGVR